MRRAPLASLADGDALAGAVSSHSPRYVSPSLAADLPHAPDLSRGAAALAAAGPAISSPYQFDSAHHFGGLIFAVYLPCYLIDNTCPGALSPTRAA